MPHEDRDWIDRWIRAVADESATMSRRKLSSIERHGGVEAAVAAATASGVHLVKLTNDKGDVLIAASLHPFEPLC